jgi:hypothetical protein
MFAIAPESEASMTDRPSPFSRIAPTGALWGAAVLSMSSGVAGSRHVFNGFEASKSKAEASSLTISPAALRRKGPIARMFRSLQMC